MSFSITCLCGATLEADNSYYADQFTKAHATCRERWVSVSRAMGEETNDDAPTLRDRFAMAALTGIMSRDNGYGYEGAAEDSFRYADAMMKAREGKP